MPLFSLRRFQLPLLPTQRGGVIDRMLAFIERVVKGWLFGCRMCGNCILQETAFICPMTCPKGLRNGLCGEASSERCVVDPTRPCTWYLIYQRSEKMGRMEKLLEINAPVDGARAGHESWFDLMRFWKKYDNKPRLADFFVNRKKFFIEYDRLLFDYRQPSWWEGDSEYHAPVYVKPISLLEANLAKQDLITTAEIQPPEEFAPEVVREKAKQLMKYVVSANFSDNAFATSRMGSMACSKISLDAGLEPVMQIQARDRTRVAIESEVLGASALGIRNILCLGGDFHNIGPLPYATPNQFDLDAVQILWILRRMRDEGKFLNGREMENAPKFFLGAAGSPFAAPHKYDAIRVEKKVNAGAQFLQTQMIFDFNMFRDWMEALDKRNLLNKVAVLSSVLFLNNAEDAHYLAGEPGIIIPESVLLRMDEAAKRDREGSNEFQIHEGLQIGLEVIAKLKQLPGVRGIHLLVEGNESILPIIMEKAGLNQPEVFTLD